MPVTLCRREYKKLQSMVDDMEADFIKELRAAVNTKQGKKFFAVDSSLANTFRRIFKRLAKKHEDAFKKFSDRATELMISKIDQDAAKRIKSSLKEIAKPLTIDLKFTGKLKESMQAATYEASDLIVSIPKQYVEKVRVPVMLLVSDPTNEGLKPTIKEVDKICQKYGRQQRNRAKNLVLDQARKTFTTITRDRMKAAGIKKYEWVHTGGSQEPRHYHKHVLNGQIFDIDSPVVVDEKTGEKGYPSTAINCKCVMRGIIEFEDF